MIVGDSITHGAEGDFTWRYRLAKWLEAEDVKFEFKGPYIGTHPPAEPHAPQPPRLVNETVCTHLSSLIPHPFINLR
jgi:hypothetical protein